MKTNPIIAFTIAAFVALSCFTSPSQAAPESKTCCESKAKCCEVGTKGKCCETQSGCCEENKTECCSTKSKCCDGKKNCCDGTANCGASKQTGIKGFFATVAAWFR